MEVAGAPKAVSPVRMLGSILPLRLLWPVAVCMLLLCAAAVTSCSPQPESARLQAIDSMVTAQPDSAVRLLQQLPQDSLRGRQDQAYYNLLLTEARYKAYIPATDSTGITMATDYYRRHPNGDRYARALISSGTTAEELGNPAQALIYYKQAASNVPKHNSFLRGYAMLRIAELYHSTLIADSTSITAYQDALSQFESVGDSSYQAICLLQLGRILRYDNAVQAKKYLNHALRLSKRLNDNSLQAECLHSLIELELNQH